MKIQQSVFRTLPFTAHAKRSPLILCSLFFGAFTAIGIWMICDGQNDNVKWGWFCTIFFGLGTLASLAQLHPKVAFLTVDEAGIEFRSLFAKRRLRWREISEFGVFRPFPWPRFGAKRVGFKYSAEFQGNKIGVITAFSGLDDGLPDTYGFRAKDLAPLLTQYHQQALLRKET